MATATRRDLTAPEFLQLVAHPLRWRLLDELGRSDRRVQELTTLVGEPPNLVSYHLGRLRKAELVTSRRSAADGRDAYYAVDLARIRSSLAAAGVALHPGLRLVPAGPPAAALATMPRRVLFLCTGNSARSQMAEALAADRSGGLVVARSAGSHPKPLHPDAVAVLRDDYGIDIGGWRSKHLDVVRGEAFDRVITLCDKVREVCPELPGQPEAVHWSMADPSLGHDGARARRAAFRSTAAELDTRIGFLLAGLLDVQVPKPVRTRGR